MTWDFGLVDTYREIKNEAEFSNAEESRTGCSCYHYDFWHGYIYRNCSIEERFQSEFTRFISGRYLICLEQ